MLTLGYVPKEVANWIARKQVTCQKKKNFFFSLLNSLAKIIGILKLIPLQDSWKKKRILNWMHESVPFSFFGVAFFSTLDVESSMLPAVRVWHSGAMCDKVSRAHFQSCLAVFVVMAFRNVFVSSLC